MPSRGAEPSMVCESWPPSPEGFAEAGPVKPESAKSVDDLKLWAVDHDARISMLWENQLATNKKNAVDHEVIISRLDRLEKRVLILVVIGTTIGSLLGNIPANWITR